jgi:HAD superfamily hydrolase (TIGR01484 family)
MLRLEAILFDMDGTTLRHDSAQITKPVYRALKAAQSQDIATMPVTSRSTPLMERFLHATALRGLMAADGGASIIDMRSREMVESRWADKAKVQAIVGPILPDCTQIAFEPTSRYHRADEIHAQDIMLDSPSVFAVFPAQNKDRIKDNLHQIPGITAHYNAYGNDHTLGCVQVVEEGVTKGYGAERLLALTGIAKENALGIGDGGNDKDLLRFFSSAGIGVAMGNAAPDLRELADYTVGSVDQNGFAQVLRPFIRAEVQF